MDIARNVKIGYYQSRRGYKMVIIERGSSGFSYGLPQMEVGVRVVRTGRVLVSFRSFVDPLGNFPHSLLRAS